MIYVFTILINYNYFAISFIGSKNYIFALLLVIIQQVKSVRLPFS